jgi:vacuolar protein sorting-associated protein 35
MPTSPTKTDVASPQSPIASEKGKEKEGAPVKKFRGIPENVKLFEVFWEQIVALIKVGYN